jgi:hypothetical protein
VEAGEAELIGFVEFMDGFALDDALELFEVAHPGQLPDVHRLPLVRFDEIWFFPEHTKNISTRVVRTPGSPKHVRSTLATVNGGKCKSAKGKETKRKEKIFVFGSRWRGPRKLHPAQRYLRLPAIMVAPFALFYSSALLEHYFIIVILYFIFHSIAGGSSHDDHRQYHNRMQQAAAQVQRRLREEEQRLRVHLRQLQANVRRSTTAPTHRCSPTLLDLLYGLRAR